jgi:hypothetical protein
MACAYTYKYTWVLVCTYMCTGWPVRLSSPANHAATARTGGRWHLPDCSRPGSPGPCVPLQHLRCCKMEAALDFPRYILGICHSFTKRRYIKFTCLQSNKEVAREGYIHYCMLHSPRRSSTLPTKQAVIWEGSYTFWILLDSIVPAVCRPRILKGAALNQALIQQREHRACLTACWELLRQVRRLVSQCKSESHRPHPREWRRLQ